MKSVSSKIPAMIAMLIALLSLGLLITAFIVSINEVEPEMGVCFLGVCGNNFYAKFNFLFYRCGYVCRKGVFKNPYNI